MEECVLTLDRHQLQPQCQEPDMHYATSDGRHGAGRLANAESKKFDPDFCLSRATHKVGNDFLCRRHAGERALDILKRCG